MIQRLVLALLLVVSMACGTTPLLGGDGGATGGGGGRAGGGSGGGGTAAGGGIAYGDVAITFSDSCAAPSPCASSPVGHWKYASACISATNPWPQVKKYCSGIELEGLSGTMGGTLDVTSTSVTQRFTWDLYGTVIVPKSCFADAGVPANLVCTAVAAILNGELANPKLVTSATCTRAGTSCACTVTDTRSIDSTSPSSYAEGGSTLTVEDTQTSSTRTYGYCASGGGLSYKETTSPALDPAVYTLR